MQRLILVALGIALVGISARTGASDEADPVATVRAFRQALETGDRATALELLSPDLLVYESGDVDATRADYSAHHLDADLAFLAKAKVHVLHQSASRDGALASVTTRSRISTPSGDLVGTETMVLRLGAQGWRIVHIHWSSRRATAKDG